MFSSLHLPCLQHTENGHNWPISQFQGNTVLLKSAKLTGWTWWPCKGAVQQPVEETATEVDATSWGVLVVHLVGAALQQGYTVCI
jgi:hypothetical protein